jgi:ribosomal protein S18 acetylase RimI-like enzyme
MSFKILRDNIKANSFYENLGFKIISFNQESDNF